MSDTKRKELKGKTATQSTGDYEYHTLMRLLGVSVSKHLIDEHFTLIWANDFYYDLIGWSKEEYEQTFHNQCDRYYEHDQDLWEDLKKAVLNALANHQNGYNIVSKIRRKDGSAVWVKFSSAFSQEYIDGYQVAYTTLTNIDDLVRVQKEQSVTYNNLPGFVAKFQVKEDGFAFLDANDRFREFFHCMGKECSLHGLSNDDTEQNRNAYTRHFPDMQKGKPVHFTLQAKDQHGGKVWLQVNADCMEWVNGEPVYLVIYIDITDITEQRELQRQLEERSKMLHDALEAAEKANRSKSEFLSRMSHDIRTPMNAIMGMTSIAEAHLDNAERVQDCLSKIKVSSKLLLSLINEVLDMSKIESGRITMGEEEFVLGDVLQNIVTIIQPSLYEKKHDFRIHAYDIQHEQVSGDPQRIEQVFLNILSNAIKYTPDHGKITLDMRELPSDKEGFGYYAFVFRDNGYGMKPEFLKKIFTPFERAQDATIYAIQGTGLGMAISRNIVRMMGGDIQVESCYGKGSAFTVTFYLKLQAKTALTMRLPKGLPILVVDDDQVSCETTCARLEELGLTGEWVLSGEEALTKVVAAHEKGKEYMAIVMDLKMPGMNGIETTRKIRQAVGTQLPVIMLSAYDWMEDELDAMGAGVNGFILKPLLKSNLVCALRRYVLQEETKEQPSAFHQNRRTYPGKRLLLVEDNELNQEIAVEMLQGTEIMIEMATNGKEAVERFMASAEGYYDFIFMDVQMPVMGGLEAARAIRALKRKDAGTVPMVAMTANVFAEDVAAVKKAGMNAHLAKPLDVRMLDQVLEKYL